jgi:hypothetical protein
MLPLYFPAIFITLLFFLSGFGKIKSFTETTNKFAKKMNFPFILAQLIIIGVIVLEIVAPMIIAAYFYTGRAALVPFFQLAIWSLGMFTILVTILYHNPIQDKKNYYAFMSNLSTLGGLMALSIAV